MKRLSLGCGEEERAGFVGLDSDPSVSPDVVWDLEQTPLPFEDGEFELVRASHILEHVHNLMPLMQEVRRILTPGGIFDVAVPMFGCKAAIIDPTHCRYFLPETFFMFQAAQPGQHPPHFAGRGWFAVQSLEVRKIRGPNEDEKTAGAFFTEIRARLIRA
jgi:SAM-dependent methyltransferase